MKIFKCYYQGFNGKKTKYIIADNLSEAFAKAKRDSILPINISPVKILSFGGGGVELENVFWQLGFNYGNGFDLIATFKAIREGLSHKENIELIDTILETLNGGENISVALKKHREVCGNLVIALFEIGEKSGNVKEICGICAKEIGSKNKFYSSIRRAFIYPIILLLAFLVVFAIISIFVIPEFIQIYDSLGEKLPLSTQYVLFISNALNNHLLELLSALLFVFAGLGYLFKIKSFRDMVLLKTPVIGNLIADYESYRYFLGLYYLLKSGTPFDKSVQTCHELIGNLHIKNEFSPVNDFLHKGKPLSEAFESITKHVSIDNLSLIKSGESGGKLDSALILNAKFYKKKYKQSLKAIKTLVEPVATIIMGIFITWLTFSVVSPMWQLLEVSL